MFVFIFISHNFLLASEAMFRIVFFPTEGKIYLPSELTCYTNSVTSLIAAVGRGLVLKICLQQLIPESQEKQPKLPPGCLTTDIQSLKPGLCITLCPMQMKPNEGNACLHFYPSLNATKLSNAISGCSGIHLDLSCAFTFITISLHLTLNSLHIPCT